MLPDMITIIASVEHVGVVQDAVVIKKPEDIVNKLINRLKSTKPRAVKFIIVFDLSVTLPG